MKEDNNEKSFNDLISSPILKALKDMGFEAPTEVQHRAIPHVLNQEDVIVMSKQAAARLPFLVFLCCK